MFGLGPNIVVRTRTAVVDIPARVTPTSVGQPVRRHGPPPRFVKPMYPPTLPAATNDRANLILSCGVVHVRVAAFCDGLPAFAQPTIASPTIVAATTARSGSREARSFVGINRARRYGFELTLKQ